MPEVPVRQIRFVMCQRTRRVRLQVHQRPCQADPENQTRSHSENNEELSWSTRTAAFLHMQWKPRKSWWGRGRTVSREKTEWKEATPPSSSTSPGTSSTPHFIWNAVLNGITDAFLRVCWLFRHMLCLIIQPRKSRSWKKTDSLKQRCSLLLYASLCGGRQAADQCDNYWKKRSEVTKRNWRHHRIAMCCSHPDPSTCPSP